MLLFNFADFFVSVQDHFSGQVASIKKTFLPVFGSNHDDAYFMTGKIQAFLASEEMKTKWCGWSESNRHSFRNRILNPARLPVPPHPHQLPLPAGKSVKQTGTVPVVVKDILNNKAQVNLQVLDFF